MVDNISNMTGDVPLQDAFTMLAGRGVAEERRKKEAEMGTKRKEAQLYEQAIPQLSQPAPEFKPPKETMDNMMSLGSMLALAGTMMGGGGMMGGIGAMQSMGAMLEAYKQNRTDEYQKAKEQYDINLKNWEKQRSIVKDILDMRLKQAAATGALQNETENAVRDLIAAGATVPAEMVKKMGLTTAAGQIGQTNQNIDAQMQTLGPAAVKFWDDLQARVAGAKATVEFEKQRREAMMPAGGSTPTLYKWKEDGVEKSGILTPAEALAKRDSKGVTELAPDKTTSRGSAMNQRFGYNMSEAFAQAAVDLENISRMPKETVLGAFSGMTGQSGTGLISSLKNVFARKLTDDDQRMFQQLIAGFANNMSRALGGGYANSGAKHVVDQYNLQVAQEGDSPAVKAMFLARAKQELKIFAKAFQTYPGATDEQKQFVQEYYDVIDQAVPFNVEDVLAASSGMPGAKPPGAAQTETPVQYKSADDVKAAVKSGALTKDQALQILKSQFGYE